jgi:hypothetical protein
MPELEQPPAPAATTAAAAPAAAAAASSRTTTAVATAGAVTTAPGPPRTAAALPFLAPSHLTRVFSSASTVPMRTTIPLGNPLLYSSSPSHDYTEYDAASYPESDHDDA